MKDDSLEPASERVSGQHELTTTAEALEQLLITAETLPVERGPRDVTRCLLTKLRELTGGVPVGACVVDPRTGESFVEIALPEGEQAPPMDPSRLFPAASNETIVGIADLPGSTLHVATRVDPVETPGQHKLVQRTAGLAASALRVSFQLASYGDESESELRAQLVQAEKIASFGRIVANVVHELANPLTSIIAYAEYLGRRARERSDGDDDIERIDRISESAQRILGLSRDLISYARPAAFGPEPILIHDVLDRALTFCEHELRSRGVTTRRNYRDRLPPAQGASGPLVQVFVNLVTNAAHAMADGGGTLEVQTNLDEEAEMVHVELRDTGSGMSETVLRRAFDPFFTTKDSEHGSGLGLAIVREIVTTHGGSIEANSTPGIGTTFRVMLPVYTPPRSTKRPARSA